MRNQGFTMPGQMITRGVTFVVSVRFCRKRQRSRGPVQRKRHLCCTGLQAKLSYRSLT